MPCPPFCVAFCHPSLPPLPLSLSLFLIARNDYLVRWGGTTSGNLRRRSFLAFARNNDLFYDGDSSPSSTLSFSPICTPHRPREWLSVPNFNQTWPNFRASGMSGDTTHHLAGFGRSFPFSSPFPVLSTISRTLPGDLSILTAHLVVCYERSFFTFFTLTQHLIYLRFFPLNFAADCWRCFFLISLDTTRYTICIVNHYILQKNLCSLYINILYNINVLSTNLFLSLSLSLFDKLLIF